MSYTPTEWAKGDIISAEKLNNIESGISNNIVSISGTSNTFDNVPGGMIGAIKIGNNDTYLYSVPAFYYIQELYSEDAGGYILPVSWYDIHLPYIDYQIVPCLVNDEVSLQEGVTINFTHCTEIKSVYNSGNDEWTYSVSFGDKVFTTNDQYEGVLVRTAIEE